uniref:GPN-loop GTPase 3 n=1 Tax=Meloidogyne javanica TaxID=6303 RepID=A0A915LP18_MELJA
MKYAQLVIGPAGSGKSTYCATIQDHCKTIGRNIFVVNLDPAAENFTYNCDVDIRELISVEDVLDDKEIKMGPNGALIFCMEYFVKNLEWLKEQLQEGEDDYFLFDCPGQIELYSHLDLLQQIIIKLQEWEFTLSTIVSFTTPSINVLSKLDLLNKEEKSFVKNFLEDEELQNNLINSIDDGQQQKDKWTEKYSKLTQSLLIVLNDYSLVKFLPLDISDEDSIQELLSVIDVTIQYGEDADVKDRFPQFADNLDDY